jgi:hypothetical protein
MLEWTQRRRPDIKREGDRLAITTELNNLGTADLGHATVSLVLGHETVGRRHEALVCHTAYYELSPVAPVSPDDAVSRYVRPLHLLHAFLSLGHVDIETMRLRLADADTDERPLWFDYRTRIEVPVLAPKTPAAHEMLATWSALESDVPSLVGGWFAAYSDLAGVMSFLVLPEQATYLYLDDHVLTAFIAVEAYHASRIGGTSLPADEHAVRVNAIVAGAPDEHKAWAREILSGKNQKGQRRQLQDLVDHARATGQAVIGAVPKFVDLAISCRQRVAHPNRASHPPGVEFLAVSRGLRWLLRHCILREMGINDDHATYLIRRCRTFDTDLRLMSEWTS